MQISELQERVRELTRGIEHPRVGAALALAEECGEVMRCVLDGEYYGKDVRAALTDEVGDVLIALLEVCDRFGIEIEDGRAVAGGRRGRPPRRVAPGAGGEEGAEARRTGFNSKDAETQSRNDAEKAEVRRAACGRFGARGAARRGLAGGGRSRDVIRGTPRPACALVMGGREVKRSRWGRYCHREAEKQSSGKVQRSRDPERGQCTRLKRARRRRAVKRPDARAIAGEGEIRFRTLGRALLANPSSRYSEPPPVPKPPSPTSVSLALV